MKTSLAIVSTFALAIVAGAGCTGCTAAKAHDPEPVAGRAVFAGFDYKGCDPVYDTTALDDPSGYHNPVLAGWYSDPSVTTNGRGDYYLATSTFTYYPGVPVFHSRDLVNWRQIGHVLTRPEQLQNLEKQHVSGGIFAPDIAYNHANDTYYMVTTNVGAGNFLVKAKDPAGPWSDPVMLPQVQGIDPSMFFDTDGRAYIVNNDDAPGQPDYPGHRTVRIVEYDTASDRCIGPRKILVDKGCRPEEKPIWCEGPHIYHIGDYYYLMTAEGGTSVGHSEVIYRGSDPMGPFTPWSGNPILTQRDMPAGRENAVTCAGHADLVEGPDGRWWGVFLACRPIEGDMENLGRETFMLPVEWTSDWWPYFTRPGQEVALSGSVPGAVRVDSTATFGNFCRHTAWTDTVLPMEWMTLRGPARQYYSLTDVPGYLSMACAPVEMSQKCELPLVCRRVHHHNYSVCTRVTFVPSAKSDAAGIALVKDESHQYLLAKTLDEQGRHCVTLSRLDSEGLTRLGSAPLPGGDASVGLKVVSRGRTVDFYTSTDCGATWVEVAGGVDAAFTSTAVAGGFTGTTVGVFATSKFNNR